MSHFPPDSLIVLVKSKFGWHQVPGFLLVFHGFHAISWGRFQSFGSVVPNCHWHICRLYELIWYTIYGCCCVYLPNSLAIFKLQRANLSPYDCWIPNRRSGFIQTLIETLIEALKYQSGQSIIGQDNLCNWEWYIYSRHSLHDILRWILQRSYCQWMVAKSESPVDGHHPIIIPVYRMPPPVISWFINHNKTPMNPSSSYHVISTIKHSSFSHHWPCLRSKPTGRKIRRIPTLTLRSKLREVSTFDSLDEVTKSYKIIDILWISRYFKTFQDISRHFKTFQDISRYFKIFQDISRYFKIFQDISRYFKIFQDISRYFKTFQDISRYFKIFQDISRYFKIFQDISRYFKTFQDISRYFKIFQDISRYFKIFQDISRYFKTFQDISRYFKIFQDISRHFKTFQDISRHFKIFQDISRYFKIFQDISRYFKIFQDISRHFKTFQDISRYFKIFQDISRYFKIFQDISRYFKIFQDISRYFKIFQDISRYFKIFQDISRYFKIFQDI